MTHCPICSIEATIYPPINDVEKVACQRCGTYHITYEAKLELQQITSNRKRANLSSWLAKNDEYELTSEILNELLELKTPAFQERADNLLQYIASQTYDNLSRNVPVSPNWISKSASYSDDELDVFIEYLEELKRIESDSRGLNGQGFRISPNGWLRLEDITKENKESNQAFVAMWFDKKMDSIYEDVIAKAVLEAGYKPLKIDNKLHNNKICDEIIAEIRKSKFIVADLTGHRGGVYYEAGFAKGLGLEVFWSCNEKYFKKLHFDIRQYNCIKWSHDNKEKFKEDLKNKIESVLGQGTYGS